MIPDYGSPLDASRLSAFLPVLVRQPLLLMKGFPHNSVQCMMALHFY